MSCHPIRWLWGLIPIAILSWIAVHVERDRIERDLEQRAGSALHEAGYDWASIVFSGRDGVLVGTPPRRGDPHQAIALVRGLWGVRWVEDRTKRAEAALAAPSPSGSSQRAAQGADKDKIALPPLATTVAVLENADAKIADLRPVAPATARPAQSDAALAEPPLDAVRVWEHEDANDSEGAGGAQRTQGGPRSTTLETAAIAAARTHSAEDCRATVRAINVTEPVRFAFGRSDLDSHERTVLDRLVAAAGDCPRVGLKVLGYADARGKAERNLALSQRRARAVVTYLIDKGIDAGRLEAVGYGEARPVAPNDTAENRAKNRRIELEITGADPTGQVASPSTGQGADNGLPDR